VLLIAYIRRFGSGRGRRFEHGKLSPERCEARLARLQSRLDDLGPITPNSPSRRHTRPHKAPRLPNSPPPPTTRTLLTRGEPKKAKALVRELLAGLKVNGKAEILHSHYLAAL
jgi:hypothetical protein